MPLSSVRASLLSRFANGLFKTAWNREHIADVGLGVARPVKAGGTLGMTGQGLGLAGGGPRQRLGVDDVRSG
jgi:hypothetical protein